MDVGHGSDAKTDWKLLLDIPGTAISPDEKSILQKSEWEKKPPVHAHQRQNASWKNYLRKAYSCGYGRLIPIPPPKSA